jgi:cytochrome c oxidase subunit 2
MLAIAVFNPNSSQAGAIADLFYIILGICAVILLIVSGMIVYSLLRFRSRGEGEDPNQVTGNKTVEVVWTVIPILLIAFMSYISARAMTSMEAPYATPDLTVIGHQWWWEVRYPSGAVTANEVHFPAGRKLLVRLESADVIHDFWAPRLARKMDMVPGHTNHIWLQADSPGTYYGACAEYCGAQHAWMRFTVIAEAPEQFAQWQQQQLQPMRAASTEEARRGAQLFRDKTCVNCHALGKSLSAPNAGPDLAHLDTRQTLAAGRLTNTFENLERWLKDPQEFKPGVLMPNLQLSDKEARELAMFLEGGIECRENTQRGEDPKRQRLAAVPNGGSAGRLALPAR